tara:strand:+ start:380 stop:697 length:318 start_codon:yes stop_codon:yes gene_type:complete
MKVTVQNVISDALRFVPKFENSSEYDISEIILNPGQTIDSKYVKKRADGLMQIHLEDGGFISNVSKDDISYNEAANESLLEEAEKSVGGRPPSRTRRRGGCCGGR